jgi:hypothetical protein
MPAAPVYSTRFRIVAVLVLTLAVGAFTVAYLSTRQGEDDAILHSGGTEDFVEALIPADNSQVPQQSTVGIDLVVGWEGTLVVDGVEIPPDQLSLTPELGLVQFTPDEGREIEQLSGGQHTVSAIVWPIAEGRDAGARTVTWQFQVV